MKIIVYNKGDYIVSMMIMMNDYYDYVAIKKISVRLRSKPTYSKITRTIYVCTLISSCYSTCWKIIILKL